MADTTTDKLITGRRDDIRNRWLRDFALANPGADTSPGTFPFILASTFADSEVVNHHNAAVIATAISSSRATGAALDEKLEEAGTRRFPAVGASGYVEINASGSGARIESGDEIKIGGKRYRCAVGAFYPDGSGVPVVGIDTGPTTDQAAGIIGKWSHPRPGIAQDATVGPGGLTGGALEESDPEAQARLKKLKATPPASGNDAHIQLAALECPGVPVEQCFTFPAINGAGVKAVAFTIRQTTGSGTSRVPTALHRALMKQHLIDRFGVEDGILVCALVDVPRKLTVKVRWASGADGWADAVPFPGTSAGLPSAARVGAVTSALAFQLTGTEEPRPGNRIAFFDTATRRFKRKTILTVGGVADAWDIVCDTSNGASDATFTPAINDAVSPWSDSLDLLVDPIDAFFRKLGPGEQVASFFDPGLRQRRSPASPESWPSEVSTRVGEPLYAVSAVGSLSLVGLADPEDVTNTNLPLPYATPVGAAGVSSNLLSLGDLAIHPL